MIGCTLRNRSPAQSGEALMRSSRRPLGTARDFTSALCAIQVEGIRCDVSSAMKPPRMETRSTQRGRQSSPHHEENLASTGAGFADRRLAAGVCASGLDACAVSAIEGSTGTVESVARSRCRATFTPSTPTSSSTVSARRQPRSLWYASTSARSSSSLNGSRGACGPASASGWSSTGASRGSSGSRRTARLPWRISPEGAQPSDKKPKS